MSLRARLAILILLCLGLSPAQAEPDTCGKQRTLFLSCSDSTGLEGPSLERLPAEVDQFVRANSGGKAWLESVALTRVALPEPILESLRAGRLQKEALAAADPRVDLRSFSRIVVLVPTGPYEVAGEGTVGKSCLVCPKGAFMASTAWVFVPNGASHSDVLRSVLHELGHGFGFHHGRVGSDTYGDHEDVMGSGYAQYGAQWRWQAGWLDAPLAEEAGDYPVPPGAVLRVRLPGSHDSYFVENHDDELQVHLLSDDSQQLSLPVVDRQRGLRLEAQGSRLRVEITPKS